MRNCFQALAAAACIYAVAAGLLARPCAAKVVGIFDFDGTIVNDRGADAAWVTPWILKRVEQIETPYQQPPNRPIEIVLTEPKQIEYYNGRTRQDLPPDRPAQVQLALPDHILVSYGDFQQLEPFLAKGETAYGGFIPFLLRYDPVFPDRQRLIIPGYYRVFDSTFKYYRESTGPRPKNYLRSDFQQARERERLLGSGASWKGAAFPLFKAFMSSTGSVSNAKIFTSRGHLAKDYYDLEDEMVRLREIPFSRSTDGRRHAVYSLNQPESRVYGRSLVEKKVNVVRAELETLYHSAGKKHWIHVDGKPVKGHTLIIAEDEPGYVDAIADQLNKLSGSYYADRVEIVLFNTGTDDEVAKARFPYRFTRFEAGRTIRPATADEIARYHDPEFLSPPDRCETELQDGSDDGTSDIE